MDTVFIEKDNELIKIDKDTNICIFNQALKCLINYYLFITINYLLHSINFLFV